MSDTTRISRQMAEAAQAVAAMGPAQAQAIGDMAELLIETFESGGKLLLCGNGGSAADAQHVACELVGHFIRDRRPLPAVALSTDVSVLTAVGNDYSFEQVFARGVEALGRSGDVLCAISTSGNSANIVKAAEAARKLGMKVIGMTGSGGGKLAGLSDVCVKAPCEKTYLVQQVHQAAYHILCDLIDEHFAR
jgi:D-sedoheptulose 7-phosphate isomerase